MRHSLSSGQGKPARLPSRILRRGRAFIRFRLWRLGRKIVNREGVGAKAATALFGQSHLIRLRFPPSVNEAPRYGYGRPPHPRLVKLLSRGDTEYEAVLRQFRAYTDELHAIPLDAVSPREPHWRNGFLFGLDGVSLYGFTRAGKPRRYMEIGSGNSTLFVDRARRDGHTGTEIISIDPYPRREIDSICDEVVRQPLESVDLKLFDGLTEGDIVFLDGTHRVFMNSDATVFFLDVLPELAPGVLVGIHDIHLPDDYRPEHADRHYSEQYLLASYLLGEPTWMRTVLPCWYVSHHPQLGELGRSLIPDGFLHGPPVNPHAPPGPNHQGVIFWLRIEPEGPGERSALERSRAGERDSRGSQP